MAESVRGAIIFDLDGVVYRGHAGIEGAGETLTSLASDGWRLLFATNNASTGQATVVDKISRLTGFMPQKGSVVTCGMAAASYLHGRAESVFVIGEPALHQTVTEAGFLSVEASEGPDAVVVGINFSFTYADVHAASSAIRAGSMFIATNTDATYPAADGLAPGAGAVVAAIATAASSAPVVTGKPEQPMIELVEERLRTAQAVADRPGDVWVVGDRPETDIEMAVRAGWRSILPLTGVVADAAELSGRATPDHVVRSISDVPRIVSR